MPRLTSASFYQYNTSDSGGYKFLDKGLLYLQTVLYILRDIQYKISILRVLNLDHLSVMFLRKSPLASYFINLKHTTPVEIVMVRCADSSGMLING